jgi:UTP--glucose-1-phosphate uridylyltransferase
LSNAKPMQIKAVISAAGYGSRFFPLTKAINKCMLPIGSRPVIDYLVAELLLAGVREIAIVTLPGDDQLRRYFTESLLMRRFFENRGWLSKYAPVAELHDRLRGTEFQWFEQPMDGRYGTAVPPLVARSWIAQSDWLLLSGDDLVLREDGGSDLADLVEARARARVAAAIQVASVPIDRVSRYGVVRTRNEGGVRLFDGAVEKPPVETAPSNLVSISRFLVDADFFRFLEALQPEKATGEYTSITALVEYAQTKAVLVHEIAGTYHDCGQPDGWLAANIAAQELELRRRRNGQRH